MRKKTIEDIEVKGKRVLVRCDFNVPMDENNIITDDIRIRSAIPTIKYLIDNKAKVILMSHLGRPKGKVNKEYSLRPVAEKLKELLHQEVYFADDDLIVSDNTKEIADKLQDGEVMLLENVRFRTEETDNDANFAKKLSELGDIFVNDAFGTSHRAHASTCGIAKYIPAVSGYLIKEEIEVMAKALESPSRPFLAILGGSKVGDKIGVVKNLLNKVDTLIIGGGMAYTFLKAKGYEIGNSLLEEDKIELAKETMKEAESKGVKLLLPVDVVVSKEFSNDADYITVKSNEIPKDMMGMDIGNETIKLFSEQISLAKTVIWNGPLGVFEMKNFEVGTHEIAQNLADSNAVKLIGGGDSAAAVKQFGLCEKMTHISTGGGVSLKLLEGKKLPGIDILQDK